MGCNWSFRWYQCQHQVNSCQHQVNSYHSLDVRNLQLHHISEPLAHYFLKHLFIFATFCSKRISPKITSSKGGQSYQATLFCVCWWGTLCRHSILPLYCKADLKMTTILLLSPQGIPWQTHKNHKTVSCNELLIVKIAFNHHTACWL